MTGDARRIDSASRFTGQPVGDATTVEAVSGVRSAAAAAVLARGGVVVFNRADVIDGHATVDLYDNDTGETKKTVTLPAVYVRAERSVRGRVRVVDRRSREDRQASRWTTRSS